MQFYSSIRRLFSDERVWELAQVYLELKLPLPEAWRAARADYHSLAGDLPTMETQCRTISSEGYLEPKKGFDWIPGGQTRFEGN